MIELFLVYFCYIFEQVRERIWEITFRPCAGLKQNIENRLLLYQVFYSLSCKPLWNSGRFSHVDTIWRRYPILLNGSPTFDSDHSDHLHCCLERLFEHGGHVKIFWKIENVRKEILACLIWTERNCEHFVFLHDQPENIPGFMYAQRLPQNHPA